ncbi:LamG domain-containing protein [Actinoplanes sp. NPDC051861]|uniref:LamG domain-containing protein n=1 Tax=Actinoplanes sp. NPDC051861 TaxID=3155170 RepID=UPI00341F8A80
MRRLLSRVMRAAVVAVVAVGVVAGPVSLAGGAPAREAPGTFTTEIGALNTPSVSPGASAWSMINQTEPDQEYWSYDRNEGAKVGYEQDSIAPNNRYRSMFWFDLASLRGKQILSATFSATLTHSYSCTASYTDLYVVGGFGPDTNWNNHSNSWNTFITGTNSESCDDARVHNEWGNAKLAEGVAGSLASGGIALGLRASNEGTYNHWKKFDPASARLSITYNSYPDMPSGATVDGKACATGTGRPYISTASPGLSARVSDPDGGILDAWYFWGKLVGGVVQQPWTNVQQRDITSGGNTTTTLAGLADNTTYAWNVTSGDRVTDSPTTPWCEFTVDTNKPNRAPVVTSADSVYPPGDGYHGGVGRSGQFRFAPNGVSDDGVNDVVGYYWGLSDPPTEYVAASALGGTALTGATPEKRGINTLHVKSVDRAGNLSPMARYDFSVAPGIPPVGRWKLDETSGTVLADASGNNHPATLAGGQLGQRSRVGGADRAVRFDGTSAQATAAGAVPRVDKSFSVGAWVRLDRADNFATAVAQDGVNGSTFYLQYNKEADRWAFAVLEHDAAGASSVRAVSEKPPRLGVWTHLAGTYDEATRKLRLYVNGQLAATTPLNSGWVRTAGTKPLTIGRAMYNAQPVDFWPGAIDDVQIWDRRIFQGELAQYVDQTSLAGEWLFDEASGTAVAGDTSGFNRPAAISGSPVRTTGHRSAGQAWSPGSAVSSAETTTPALLTDQSFSVSAWVRLPGSTSTSTVVGQDGSQVSGFFLQYLKETDKNPRWAFSMPFADEPNPPEERVGRASAEVRTTAGEWVHLVGVHDVGRAQLRLYVNGAHVGTGSMPDAWSAGGPLTIGRAKFGNRNVDNVRGDIDDVRVFVGVLEPADIVNLYLS